VSQHSRLPLPDVFGLVGHPVRWALLSELALSDRRVGGLADALAMPQNGVSYHLARLRSSGASSMFGR
jgi:ArsR family transcriptional regulator, arsenate/arsenite/antimonite-responsive transcriptional repressor / arsenate reductase (thioredoxin)